MLKNKGAATAAEKQPSAPAVKATPKDIPILRTDEVNAKAALHVQKVSPTKKKRKKKKEKKESKQTVFKSSIIFFFLLRLLLIYFLIYFRSTNN